MGVIAAKDTEIETAREKAEKVIVVDENLIGMFGPLLATVCANKEVNIKIFEIMKIFYIIIIFKRYLKIFTILFYKRYCRNVYYYFQIFLDKDYLNILMGDLQNRYEDQALHRVTVFALCKLMCVSSEFW